MPELETPKLKCIWNANRIIPDTFTYSIEVEVTTSADIESLVTYLQELINGTLESISMSTNAKETLNSIKYHGLSTTDTSTNPSVE